MSSLTIGDAELVRNGTVVTCLVGGRAYARLNLAVAGASPDVPLTLFLADRKFALTLEQTRLLLDGMPQPEPAAPVAVEEVASDVGTTDPVVSDVLEVVEEAAPTAPAKRTRRTSTTA